MREVTLLRLVICGLAAALFLVCALKITTTQPRTNEDKSAAGGYGSSLSEPSQPLPQQPRPRNTAGRLIPQVLYDEERQGKNTMLQGSIWEPMDPIPGRQSTKGPLGRDTTALLIIDMQPLFYHPTSPWGAAGGLGSSGMDAAWPRQLALARKLALFSGRNDSTFLTMFLPPAHASEARGIMKHYFEEESAIQLDVLRAANADVPYLLGVMPQLQPLLLAGAPASTKPTGGAFGPGSSLPGQLDAYFAGVGESTRTLIVTGVETDFCVISTILGALDHYYRVIVATDAISSSQPNAAQAQLDYTLRRFDHMVDLVTTEHILSFLS